MNSLNTKYRNAVGYRSFRAIDRHRPTAVYDLFSVSLPTPFSHVTSHLSLQERLRSPDGTALRRQIAADFGARMQAGCDCSRPTTFRRRFRGSASRAQVQDAALSSGGLENLPLAIGNGASNSSVVPRRNRSGAGTPGKMWRSNVDRMNSRLATRGGSRALTTSTARPQIAAASLSRRWLASLVSEGSDQAMTTDGFKLLAAGRFFSASQQSRLQHCAFEARLALCSAQASVWDVRESRFFQAIGEV